MAQAPARRAGPGTVLPLVALALLAIVALIVLTRLTTVGYRGREMPDLGAAHVGEDEPVGGDDYPPASGPHYGWVAEYGIHDQPQKMGHLVHNLEHGDVVILYRCDAPCPELRAQLAGLLTTFQKNRYGRVPLVVAPDPTIRHRIVVLAWRWRDEMDGFDLERLHAFYRARVGGGPEGSF